MDIELFLIVIAPIASVSMFIWVSLHFARSPKLTRARLVAFKVWAIALQSIMTALTINGIVWNLQEYGSLSIKKLLSALLLFTIPMLFIWINWDLFIKRNGKTVKSRNILKGNSNGFVDIKAMDKDGRTPLHLAAGTGQLADSTLLIEKGADVNAKDNNGFTPLQLAAGNGHKEVAELLIAKGADVNAKDNTGATPVGAAAYYGHKDMTGLLIAKGADIHAKDAKGVMPLHAAAGGGSRDIVGLLIAKGAVVDAKDEMDETPLHIAVFEGHKNVVELFLAKGADVNATTRQGLTPVYIAEMKNLKDISDLLKKHGGSNTVFPTCRKCSKKTSKAGNYTNMYLSGILDPLDFDNLYGMMCGDHAGEVTKIIMKEKGLSKSDWVAANQKALKVLEQDLM